MSVGQSGSPRYFRLVKTWTDGGRDQTVDLLSERLEVSETGGQPWREATGEEAEALGYQGGGVFVR